MKRYLLILAGLMVFIVGPALAETVVYYPPRVTTRKMRKHIRYFLYGRNLTGDKKAIFDKYGWTPHRLRFNSTGRVTERWKYLDEGLEFVFDQKGNLIEERTIKVEHRRSFLYQK
jgi:hypothetical protein